MIKEIRTKFLKVHVYVNDERVGYFRLKAGEGLAFVQNEELKGHTFNLFKDVTAYVAVEGKE